MKLVIIATALTYSLISANCFAFFDSDLDHVKDRLKDPYSAKFENVIRPAKSVVCGQVNSKNGFGAYTGRKNFVIVQGIAALESEDSGAFQKYCVELPKCIKSGTSESICLFGKPLENQYNNENIKNSVDLAAQAKEWNERLKFTEWRCKKGGPECETELQGCRDLAELEEQTTCFHRVGKKY